MLHSRVRAIKVGLLLLMLIFGSNSSVLAQGECNVIGTPLVTTGSVDGSDPVQTSRLFRDGRNTTCLFNRPQFTSAGTFRSEQNTFTNTEAGPVCVQVDLDATGCGVATNQVGMAAYLGSYNPASILTNVIADPGLSTGQNFATSMSFSVGGGATYVIVVHTVNADPAFCPSYTFRRTITNNCRNVGYDRANDTRADLAYFRPSLSNSIWASSTADTGVISVNNLGSSGDIPVGGDYVGDETSKPAVFRPSTGIWYTSTNPATNYGARAWGTVGDIPFPADYDRDGVDDLAIYRPSTNRFFILRSSTSSYQEVALGVAGDRPVVSDFDGDGKADIGVFRSSNGLWRYLGSAGNFNTYNDRLWGASGDTPVPADYDGDGKADVAVFRPSNGNWYIFRSSLTAGQPLQIPFGLSGDVPQPADYDGDRKADIGVFRNGTWYLLNSNGGSVTTRTFGQAGDIPATTPYSVQ